MEKLIELLNEYNGQDSYWLDEDSISKEKYINRGDGYQCFINEHIISKRFGFIKWLVDNDKIDFSREGEYCIKSIEEFDGLLRDNEDGLMMILSISDTPIDDLISYLK